MTDSPVTEEYGFFDEAAARFPSCVQLTLCHYICNCACITCPVGRLNRKEKEAAAQWHADGGDRSFLSWEVFQKAADETGQHPHAFMRLHARGEPTLHPHFVEMIIYAKNAGVGTIQVFTNGIALERNMAVQILESGLDVIEFSIHGHERTYAGLMGTDTLSQVITNVEGFVKLRDKLGKNTKVVVSAVDQPGFQPDKEIHRKFWCSRVDQVILRPLHSWGGRVPCESHTPPQRHPCSQLWTRLTIGPSGNILFCFNSWDEAQDEIVANLLDPQVTIAGVWQSESYNEVRRKHLEGDYTLQCCADCHDWVGSAWGINSYEHLLKKLRV